jgi:hypothetical protein
MAQKLLIDIIANDKSKQALGNVQKGLSRLKQSVFNLKNAFIGLGAGLVIKGFVDAGIQVENLSVQLKTLFGSAKAGENALRSITKFAATTPFELKNIQQGVTSLAVVRKNAEAAGLTFEDLLTLTGNVAAQMGGDFAFASFQIQKAFSTGIAAAEALKERGVAGMAGFKSGVSVNAMDTIKIMNKAFGKGGEFGNLMEELSKTLFGTISNLKDAFFIFQVEVSKGFFKALKQNLGDLKKTVEENKKEIDEFGAMIGTGLSKAINGTASALKFMKDNIGLLTEAFKLFISLKVVSFFYNLAVAIGVAKGAMLGFNSTVRKNLLIGGAVLIISQINQIIDGVKRLAKIGQKEPIDGEAFLEDGQKMIEVIDRFGNKVKIVVTDLSKMEGVVINTLPAIKEAETAFEKFARVIKESLSSFGEDAFGGFKKGLTSSLDVSVFNRFEEAGKKSLKSLESSLSDFVMTGKLNFESLRIAITRSIVEALIGSAVTFALKKATAIFKFQAIREGLISAYKAGAKALASVPFPFNLAAAGAVIGTGIGLVNKIKGFQSGGAVSKGKPIMVGEQGAELFIPNQTGQITQSARGTGGGETNVNFTINATDVRGIKELLINNRSTIVNVINSALNEKGKEALV